MRTAVFATRSASADETLPATAASAMPLDQGDLSQVLFKINLQLPLLRLEHKDQVLGGGLMGGGIAAVNTTKAKVPTRIKEIDGAGVARGLAAAPARWLVLAALANRSAK